MRTPQFDIRSTLRGASDLWDTPAGAIAIQDFFEVSTDSPSQTLVKRWNGSAWVDKPLKRWNGSAWVDVLILRQSAAGFVTV